MKILNFILGFILSLAVVISSFILGYNTGIDIGHDQAIEYFNVMLDDQMKKDSIATEWIFQMEMDTVSYIVSKKQIIENQKRKY